MARGQLAVTDADTGDTVVSGSDVVTWREEPLGTARRLRVGMQQINEDDHLQLPLMVGAVMASAIRLSTDPESSVRFPEEGHEGILTGGAVPEPSSVASTGAGTTEHPQAVGEESAAEEEPAADASDEDERSAEVVGLGDETEMEPFTESSAELMEEEEEEETEPGMPAALEPEPDIEDEIPLWSPPADDGGAIDDEDSNPDGLGGLRFDADDDDDPVAAFGGPPLSQPEFIAPIPAPLSAPVVVGHISPVGDDDGGTVFSSDLAATHKPEAESDDQLQVLAVPCARGHANPPGSRGCRICSAPVDSSNPRLINRPALAGIHSNQGDFADVREAVVVGRSPDASKGPPGAHLMRVPSPSSDISRSHLIVAARDWSVIVTDLDSTNGTTVLPMGEQSFVLANGESVQVDLGTVLDLGDGVSLRIEPPRG